MKIHISAFLKIKSAPDEKDPGYGSWCNEFWDSSVSSQSWSSYTKPDDQNYDRHILILKQPGWE